jgi:biotin carboxylase
VGALKTLVFLGCTKSGSSKDATEAAKQLGFYNILFTDRPSFLKRRDEFSHVDKMMLVDLKDPQQVLEKVRELQAAGKDIRAVVSFMDSCVLLAAQIGEQLGLPNQTVQAIERVQDKIALRELLKDTAYSVAYQVLAADDDETELYLRLPVVVKSPRSTGSKDVLLATSQFEYEQHVRRLRAKYPGHDVLVEEYIAGPQYLAEVLVHDGIPHLVAVIDQTVTLEQRFIVTGYCVLPTLPPEVMDAIHNMVNTICERIGMEVGAFHVEFKMSRGRCRIIEVNPRISGAAMNRMISYAYGINLVKQTIRSLFRETPDLVRKKESFVYARYVTTETSGILEKVTGRKRARRVPLVQEVFIKPRKNAFLSKPTSMGHRYAYVIAEADSAEAARKAANKAADQIRFHVRPARLNERPTHSHSTRKVGRLPRNEC